MSTSHWDVFHRHWIRLGSPLRPNLEVVRAFESTLAQRTDRVLLLGVTPELANLGRELTAIDRNPGMLAHVWPGDTAKRRATQGDWLSLPFPAGHFSAVIGDGSLNALLWPADYRRLWAQVRGVLATGGVCCLRVFTTPEQPESLGAVRAAALAGGIRAFHAFKWRLAMAIVAATADPNVQVKTILDVFNDAFADRAALATATGWHPQDIATIDAYHGSRETYSFPTLAQLRETLPDARDTLVISPSGTYELAERCPLIVLRSGA